MGAASGAPRHINREVEEEEGERVVGPPLVPRIDFSCVERSDIITVHHRLVSVWSFG